MKKKYEKMLFLFSLFFSKLFFYDHTFAKNNSQLSHSMVSLKDDTMKINIGPRCDYISAALQEDLFEAITLFEKIFESNSKEINQYLENIDEKNRIYGVSDTEGKYFIMYAWLRLSGMVEKFNFNEPEYIEYDIEKDIFIDNKKLIGTYRKYRQELRKDKYKDVFYDEVNKIMRFPKLKIKNEWSSTCIHLGDILDRGKHGTICLLTLLYLKDYLNKNINNKSNNLILVLGNHEIHRYSKHYFDILGSDEKKDLLIDIVCKWIEKGQIKFFDKIKIGGQDVLLTHREISKQTAQMLFDKKIFGNFDIQEAKNFLLHVDDMNKHFIENPQKKTIDCDKWIEVDKNDTTNIFLSQLCGHYHHGLRKGRGRFVNKGRDGYFFFDKKNGNFICYFDNFSTTEYIGIYGPSTANIHVLDKSKKVDENGDLVFEFKDTTDNFHIFNNLKEVQ